MKLKENAVFSIGMYLFVVSPLIDTISKFRSHEESLEKAVDVAGSSDVGQSFIIGFCHLNQFIFMKKKLPRKLKERLEE